jgi:hypothetical protein
VPPYLSILAPQDHDAPPGGSDDGWGEIVAPKATDTVLVRIPADVLEYARGLRLLYEAKEDYLRHLRLHSEGNPTAPEDQVEVRRRDVVRLVAAARPDPADLDEQARRCGDMGSARRPDGLRPASRISPHGD